MPRNIRKGDQVMVMAGKDRHKANRVGKVLRVIVGKTADDTRVVVEGMNVCRKHVKPSQRNPQGGLIDKEMPLHISNVMPVVDGKPTRVRFQTKPDGSKVRVAARNGATLGQELRTARK